MCFKEIQRDGVEWIALVLTWGHTNIFSTVISLT
jgi:hypothetical protein